MTDPSDTGWSKPPAVDKDAARDFDAMASDKYEGMSLADAKSTFAGNDLNWDTMTAAQFRAVVRNLARSRDYADTVGPACFVFCDHMIPEQHRRGWVIAVMAARDVHEGD